jgi:hypothetical protein
MTKLENPFNGNAVLQDAHGRYANCIVLYCIVFSGEQTHPQFHSKYVHSQIFVAATIYKMSQLLHQVYNLTI